MRWWMPWRSCCNTNCPFKRRKSEVERRLSSCEQCIETKRFCCRRALDFDTAFGLLNRRALAYYGVSFGKWYKNLSNPNETRNRVFDVP